MKFKLPGRLIAVCVLVLAVLVAVALSVVNLNSQQVLAPGELTTTALPADAVNARDQRQKPVLKNRVANNLSLPQSKHILFGDMHVHTTYSADAFLWSLPFLQGTRGAHPPADACDYARYVSQLDFFWLTDHAESYSPELWRDSVEAIRHCNAVSGESDNPDLVAFIGWEWTQVGLIAETHYGHHNVFFKDLDEDKIPSRPIAASGASTDVLRGSDARIPKVVSLLDPINVGYYTAYNHFAGMMTDTPVCEKGVNTRDLPANCFETASNPGKLFEKIHEWGFDTIVAPHGTTWGYYTPPNADWSHQLKKDYFDPELMRLIEVYSGHGNSENYEDFRARKFTARNDTSAVRCEVSATGDLRGEGREDLSGCWRAGELIFKACMSDGLDVAECHLKAQHARDEFVAKGEPYCPKPQPNYLPSCWQAGEIIRKRCSAAGETAQECDQRAQQARKLYANVDHAAAWLTVPDTQAEDWLDAGQARDMFLPAYNYRAGKSVQYGLALQNFDDPENPLRYRWGFIASTDNHSARPGTGFKQYDRQQATEANGPRSQFWADLFAGEKEEPEARARPLMSDEELLKLGRKAMETERQASFWSLGGIVAVHAESRHRDEIWAALKRKEVYGTSGPRLLLWFDLINDAQHPVAMGGEVSTDQNPIFRVSAAGAFKQLPGCPDYVKSALSEKRLDKLAKGECYNPSDERYLIDRIEVVRIRPQRYPGEPVDALIEDKWKVLPCEPNAMGCTVEFSDPAFSQSKRDTLYYARAIQQATPTVNGSNMRPLLDEKGEVIAVSPCHSDYRTDVNDDCLSMAEHRAWSSPIYVDYGVR